MSGHVPEGDSALAPAATGSDARRLGARLLGIWLALVAAAATAAFLDGQRGVLESVSGSAGPVAFTSLVLFSLALGCEFMDATIGMGYGTTLTPVLLILGFPVKVVVPAALLSQLLANVMVAFFHHKAGNYDFWRDHHARNAGLIMGGVGLVVAAVTMSLAIKIDAQVLRTGITLMVIAIGVFMVVARRLKVQFRMRNVALLAAIAAFNKAFSGGGYGPLVAGGQVLVGMPVKAAVATTAIAEALVCTAAVAAFFLAGERIPLNIVLPLLAGALLSTPISAATLRRLPERIVKRIMGFAIMALGIWALVQGKGI